MKGYKKIWAVSFVLSVLSIGLSVFVFLQFMKNTASPSAPQTQNTRPQSENITEEYTEPQDNVGYVSFTEDQITELARNIFSLDDYLSDISVNFTQNRIVISARISDVDNLLTTYPELKKYSALLNAVEDREITVNGSIVDNNGRAKVSVDTVTVAGVPIDGAIISPFIESDDFSRLFDVDFDDIEITDGSVVFKDGVPEILRY